MRISEFFCGPGEKESGTDGHSCQQRSIARCTEEAVRGIMMGGEREKVSHVECVVSMRQWLWSVDEPVFRKKLLWCVKWIRMLWHAVGIHEDQPQVSEWSLEFPLNSYQASAHSRDQVLWSSRFSLRKTWCLNFEMLPFYNTVSCIPQRFLPQPGILGRIWIVSTGSKWRGIWTLGGTGVGNASSSSSSWLTRVLSFWLEESCLT